jgi:division protein CdvB (Snf7/Vps24/ESCRT-III family)
LQRELEPEPEVEAPAQTLAVQAMVSQLDKLHQGMEARHHSIRDLVGRLREIEILARTGSYDSDTPIRKAVEELEEDVARIVDSYNAIKMQAEELSAAMAGEGVTPAAPPAVLRESLEDAVTPSIRRRLLRRQLLREGKANKAF